MTARAQVLGLALLTGLAACGGGPRPGDRQPAPDTLRGTVTVVGAEPTSHPVLRSGEERIRLEGPEADRLRRVNGLVVRVDGHRTDGVMRVTAFRVREADGVPAADGVLEIDGVDAVLVTAGDSLRYSPVPSSLRALVGRRVWIAGEPGYEPQAWGVIE